MMKPMRTLLVGSSGGHLAQLHQLKPWWERHDRKWVTFEKPDALSLLAGEQTEWAYQPTTRNIPNMLRNLRLSWKVLREYRPDVVVSTGAGVAFPFFVMAKALRMKTAEPVFYYHAGMIAIATGRTGEAKDFLKRAMALNPKFDFVQAPLAEKALASLPSF